MKRSGSAAWVGSWVCAGGLLALAHGPVHALAESAARSSSEASEVAAAAPAHPVAAAVLEDLRLHGYVSPMSALQRLREADPPPADAPVALRRRWAATLGFHATRQKDAPTIATARAALQRLATDGKDRASRVEIAVLDAQQAQLDGDMPRLAQAVAALDALPPPSEADVRIDWWRQRADAHDSLGEFDVAITLAVQAADAARLDGQPAEQALAYNLLVRSNSGRRDAPRAIALAREGYALARQAGFRYAMLLLRANEGYARSTLNQPGDTERGAALEETLQLARSTPGLAHIELNTLINLSNYSNDRHDYAKGERFGAAAEALSMRLHDDDGHAFALVDRGVALVHLGEGDRGLAMIREGIAWTDSHGQKLETADLLAQLVDAADVAGHPREALEALRRLTTMREALTKSKRDQDVLQLQERFSVERKTREIERLQLENAKRRAESAVHDSQRRVWASTAVAVSLAALMLAQWLARTRRRARALQVDNERLAEQSSHDPLTGAFNRRHCERLMGTLEHAPGRAAPCVGLIVLDVDHFKAVNDTHGHAAGDAVLVAIAQRLKDLVRVQDAVVRWGGEEFVLVLPGTPADALPLVAERVLATIGERPVVLADGTSIAIKVSGGAVTWPAFPHQHWADALSLADLGLYVSKTEGRNRVTCLSAVHDGADLDRVRRDLRQAAAARDVSLRTVEGPSRPDGTLTGSPAVEGLPTPEGRAAPTSLLTLS